MKTKKNNLNKKLSQQTARGRLKWTFNANLRGKLYFRECEKILAV